MNKSAVFSECGKYRYQLSRVWDAELDMVMCCGLNPSTANGEKDDPTIRTLTKALKKLGYGGFVMVNLYAYITPNPKELFNVADPMGENEEHIKEIGALIDHHIFAWGSFKGIEYRSKQMERLFPNAVCFGKSSTGAPWHPLSLMYKGIKEPELIRYNSK